nr:TsaB protein [Nitratidesulfovibrio sp. HK-II]
MTAGCVRDSGDGANGASDEAGGDGAITLALNAAESRVQAAALRGDETVFAQEWHVPSQGTELLAPALADAFTRMRLSLRDVRRIACVQGPGSFTGLRLVLSTAAGMARALGARQAGLSYTQLLACGPLLPRGAVLWVLTHARRGLVHMQAFRMPGETVEVAAVSNDAAQPSPRPAPLPEPLTPVEAATLSAAVARMVAARFNDDAAVTRMAAAPSEEDGSGRVFLMGSGATRNRAVLAPALAELLPQACFLPARFDHPAPALLLPLAAAAAYGPDDVQPLYVRPCDAEENLPAMAAARGMDPEQARRELARLTSSPLTPA